MINSYRRDLLDCEIKAHQDVLSGIVLDIGGGTARGIKINLKACTRHITFDSNKKTKPTVIGDAEILPFKDGVIDSIKCTEVIEYLEFPEKAIIEMNRVTKLGGKLMISIPFNMGIHYDHDYIRPTKYKIEKMFQKANLKIIYFSEQGKYFTVLGYMLKQAILNTESRARWVLYWTFPLLDMFVKLDTLKAVKSSEFMSSFTTGYFLIAKKSHNIHIPFSHIS